MKKQILTLCSLAALPSLCWAGSKAPLAPPPQLAPPAFQANELQLDIFGAYGVGKGPDHAGPFADHAWGGGLGLNYFLTNNLGIGVDADIKQGRENHAVGTERRDFKQFTGSLIYRMPYEDWGIAPYGYLGGGVTTDKEDLASAHAGLGVEYRLAPNQIGLFADARWTYYGERLGRGDQNNVQIRTGIRLMF